MSVESSERQSRQNQGSRSRMKIHKRKERVCLESQQ